MIDRPVSSPPVAPIVKTIRVQVPVARAFEVFTAGITRWWLPAFSVNPTHAPIAAVVMEPRAGGRWYERGVDDSECDWGQVLLWEPPTRLLIDWQVSGRSTEVEVRFTAVAPDVTEVILEHRHLDRLGDAATVTRPMLVDGWDALLGQFGTVLEARP